MARTTKTCKVSSAQAGRVDLVVQALTRFSRAEVRGLFDHDCVTIDARPAPEAGERVAGGETVEVIYDPHSRYQEKPRVRTDRTFKVLYEDDEVIVVDKAAFVLTVPTDNKEDDTLVQRIGQYLGKGGRARPVQVVQRLDRGTSGVLVFAITPTAATELIRQFSRHEPRREYLALVAGNVPEDKGTIESRLATNKGLSRYSTPNASEGERAVTHWQVEARFTGATLLRVRLETGRRNQIRVHLAEEGHPVLGDTRYLPDRARHKLWNAKRQALHAALLAFRHPVTGQEMRFESPLPSDFQKVVDAMRRDRR